MLKVHVTNLGKYNEGELVSKMLTLPTDDDEINQALKEIGINKEYEEYFLADWEWPDKIISGFPVGENSRLSELNNRLEEFENIVKDDIKIFNAIFNSIGDFNESLEIYQKGNYTYLLDVTNKCDLGHALINEIGVLSHIIPLESLEEIEDVLDYEAIVDKYGNDYTICSDDDIAISIY